MRVRRAQIVVQAGRRVEAVAPQEHAPDAVTEVDFGEVWIVLDAFCCRPDIDGAYEEGV